MKITITFLFLVANLSFGQTKFIVKDSLTGKPIPYVSGWSNQDYIGFSSDKKGKINVRKTDINTELTFFTSAYNSKKIKIRDIKKTVLLQPKVTANKDTIVLKKEIENYLSGKDLSFSVKNNYASSKSPTIIAQYIPFSSDLVRTPFIGKVEFGIGLLNVNVPYKIRFFHADENLKPSSEILSEEIIRTLKSNTSYNGYLYNLKEVNNQVDLSSYKIKIPNNGLFISIEVLNLEENNEVVNNINKEEIEVNIFKFLIRKDVNLIQYKYHNNIWVEDESDHKIAMSIALTN